MENLVIYGLSNPVIIKLIEAINRNREIFNLLGLIKSPDNKTVNDVLGYPVLGTEELIPDLIKNDNVCFFNNVNYSPAHMKKADIVLERYHCRKVSLIHPDIDMSYVKYGTNIMLCEGTIVGPDVNIGNHLTCRLGSIISHEVTNEDYVYISPGVTVCGNVKLMEGCDIGAGTTILPTLKVGRNSIIGAGAVITKDIPDNVTAVGVPARVIKHHGVNSNQ